MYLLRTETKNTLLTPCFCRSLNTLSALRLFGTHIYNTFLLSFVTMMGNLKSLDNLDNFAERPEERNKLNNLPFTFFLKEIRIRFVLSMCAGQSILLLNR